MIKCTKCGGTNVEIVDPTVAKEPQTPTMDEFIEQQQKPVPLVYKMTTLLCKDCGYSVSY